MSALRNRAQSGAISTKTVSIGVVLERLRTEFPDVTVSKIRFLESEGLISPQRTSSGYRRFTHDDIERLRYILVTQRDNYTPLKVIREQLEAMDSGQVTAIVGAASAEPLISPETFRASTALRLSDHDLAEQAQVSVDFVVELYQIGLIKPDNAGFFNVDDVRIVSTASALKEFGFDSRQLKTLRTAAIREAGLIEQVSSPVAKSGKDTARQQAEELNQQMSALVVSLHATLLKNALREDNS
ncbi:MerR family DNA-binding transcriptional regulator [Corynebacterium poyangense]|uniref:MerR family DNA-binding transcriptional regulator n=1 Tax=Corynebacterium poyangense TaxID=2684405 RepID=A0A7H0SNR4_9CORY|nr:MerR family transcriptional regulator [Corynebacterium poyangense]MBZ8177736.1 MerR family DNA-binding transcriptional regulator [Corynebacterium poyangense]QNQ90189.1 MerR family DNA-binding transcriptional regulator [Corynebacterium poyangense]